MDVMFDSSVFDGDVEEAKTAKIPPLSKSPPHTAAPLDLSFKTFISANGMYFLIIYG